MLTLIGMGLWDADDISQRGLAMLKEADIVFAEQYTNLMAPDTIAQLEKRSKKRIAVLTREQVEGEKEILDAAKSKNVALLVPGDPGIATTHISLMLAAKKAGITVGIVHCSSILSAAVSASGLQVYSFGKLVTVPKWSGNYKPASFFDTVAQNLDRGLHTLLLLDIGLDAKAALGQLLKASSGRITEKTEVFMGSRIGNWAAQGHQKLSFGPISKLLQADLGELPSVIIVPGKLHFMEQEALRWLSK